MPQFDRKKSPPDARDYRLVNFMVIAPLPTQKVEWQDVTILDQGAWGHCVGFGVAGFGNAAPIEDRLTNNQGHALYYKAKENDGEPGQENGSSVRSGAKSLQDYGYINSYAFTYDLDEMKQWILTTGPLIVGTVWLSDMTYPDTQGFVRGSGRLMGGHCYLMTGYDPATDQFTFVNSWGTKFGAGGKFYMGAQDWFDHVFSYVLNGQTDGEACAAVETGTGQEIPEIVPPLVPQPPGGCLGLVLKLLGVW